VVGSFNDWTPGLHTLEPTSDGTLAVTVVVEPEHDLHFRYLDSNESWFDDPEADAITEYGSLIFAARLPADGPVTGTSSRSDPEPNEASPTPVGATSAGPASDASSAGTAKTRRATKQTA
jgi:hypothetical protein